MKRQKRPVQKASIIREYWPCIVPPGKSGEWYIEQFIIDKQGSAFSSLRIGGYVPEGEYTKLVRGKSNRSGPIMSDTPKEKLDHMEFFLEATGRVLINGLGLGCALNVVLHLPGVAEVTVIELSPDVIRLVAPSFPDPRVTIIEADARTWTPPRGVRYGAVWHDIWDSICGDNLPEMKSLHRRYGRRTNWQGSWARDQIRK